MEAQVWSQGSHTEPILNGRGPERVAVVCLVETKEKMKADQTTRTVSMAPIFFGGGFAVHGVVFALCALWMGWLA